MHLLVETLSLDTSPSLQKLLGQFGAAVTIAYKLAWKNKQEVMKHEGEDYSRKEGRGETYYPIPYLVCGVGKQKTICGI